jgi:hypothetical protein
VERRRLRRVSLRLNQLRARRFENERGVPRRRIQPGSEPPLQNRIDSTSPCEKDRQRYALHLTVLWFRLARISKKTVRNTVNVSGYER